MWCCASHGGDMRSRADPRFLPAMDTEPGRRLVLTVSGERGAYGLLTQRFFAEVTGAGQDGETDGSRAIFGQTSSRGGRNQKASWPSDPMAYA